MLAEPARLSLLLIETASLVPNARDRLTSASHWTSIRLCLPQLCALEHLYVGSLVVVRVVIGACMGSVCSRATLQLQLSLVLKGSWLAARLKSSFRLSVVDWTTILSTLHVLLEFIGQVGCSFKP